jgi:two-component system nitrogen regulation response regulator GlnG
LLHRAPQEEVARDACGLVGQHDSVQRVRQLVSRLAGQEAHVLLLGESGTGKELVANAIHQRSARSARAMVAVNMAAIPTELAAVELFGVRRGAFTGAEADRAGYFCQADGGTLFLDEIGACGSALQAQLLRALQQGEIQRPGGGTVSVDVRVLAATDAVPGDGFSTALRHRLGSFEIHMPPLRERRADLGRLMAHFLPAAVLESAGRDPRDVSRWVTLVERMALCDWPGNVRQLANACRQLEVASTDGLIVPDTVSRQLDGGTTTRQDVGVVAPAQPPSDQRVREAMLAARWEISRAARELAMSRQALYRRIEAIPELRIAADIPAAEVESAYRECSGNLEQAALRLQVSRAGLQRRWRAMDLLSDGW